MGIVEARQILVEGPSRHSYGELMFASYSLMELCRKETGEVTIEDAFRCLDFGGAAATAGARCLYVLTGRDGLGWGVGGAFLYDRYDWESYLRKQHPGSLAHIAPMPRWRTYLSKVYRKSWAQLAVFLYKMKARTE